MIYLPLLGILLVVIGFALRMNPMLVVTASAIVTGLLAGMDPVRVRWWKHGEARSISPARRTIT